MKLKLFFAAIFCCSCIVACGGSSGTAVQPVIQTTNTPAQFNNNTSHAPFTNNTTLTTSSPPVSTSDASGQIAIISFSIIENFKTTTNVNFSFATEVLNTGSTAANVAITISGKNSDKQEVYGTVNYISVDPLSRRSWILSVGEPLTISQWLSITGWEITKVEKL